MAWSSVSSEAGLAGLTEQEAGIAALNLPFFQNLPDPLDNPDGKILVVSMFKLSTHACTYIGCQLVCFKLDFSRQLHTHAHTQICTHIHVLNTLLSICFFFSTKQPVGEYTKEGSWYDIGKQVGLQVVDDEEVELEEARIKQEAEDAEVERINFEAEQRKHRVLKGI